MKYIDAERLKAEIEKRMNNYNASIEKNYDNKKSIKAERDSWKWAECKWFLNLIASLQQEQTDMGEVSDGYHTFNELYYYRMLYNAAFFNLLPKEWVHKSKRHHTGEECFGGGWFIVMANLPTGQISNHYELKDWDLFKIPEKELADEWDGHTPQEAAERLHKYLTLQESAKRSYKDCNSCEYNRTLKDQIGWQFQGCFGGDYKGKPIAEIELCPLKAAALQEPEVDLDEEIEKELRLHYNDDQDVYWWNYLKNSFRHFYRLGRKQILQEIYDGKTKPVDKITAAWLDDKEENK